MEPKTTGRLRTTFTQEQKEEILSAAAQAPRGEVDAVLKRLRVHPSAYYRWKRDAKKVPRPAPKQLDRHKQRGPLPPTEDEVNALRALVKLAMARGFLGETVGR